MNKKRPSLIIISLVVLLSLTSHAALNVMLSDQGSGVKNKATGNEVALGNLTVEIWTAPSGGSLVYNETFTSAIVNGSWNVMLGANASKPLPLEFGRTYYKDYWINNEDANFTNYTSMIDRQFFYSPLGDLNYEDANGSFSFWNRSTVSIFNIFYNLGKLRLQVDKHQLPWDTVPILAVQLPRPWDIVLMQVPILQRPWGIVPLLMVQRQQPWDTTLRPVEQDQLPWDILPSREV